MSFIFLESRVMAKEMKNETGSISSEPGLPSQASDTRNQLAACSLPSIITEEPASVVGLAPVSLMSDSGSDNCRCLSKSCILISVTVSLLMGVLVFFSHSS